MTSVDNMDKEEHKPAEKVSAEMLDADGKKIFVGSVLKHIEDSERGVVVKIVKAGELFPVYACAGDLNIATGNSVTRVSRNYCKWKHIPRAEQTYQERFKSWKLLPSYYDKELHKVSEDEYLAISGIMALFPEDPVDYDYGPFADSLEEALHYLVKHLEEKDGVKRR